MIGSPSCLMKSTQRTLVDPNRSNLDGDDDEMAEGAMFTFNFDGQCVSVKDCLENEDGPSYRFESRKTLILRPCEKTIRNSSTK